MSRKVLFAVFALTALVALADDSSGAGSSDDSFLGLVKAGDRFDLETRSGEPSMYSLSLLTDAEAERREQERTGHEKRMTELLERHDWVTTVGSDTPERQKVFQDRFNAEEGRNLYQEYISLRSAARERTYAVKRVGRDYVAYRSDEQIIYLPVNRIFSIKESVERFQTRNDAGEPK